MKKISLLPKNFYERYIISSGISEKKKPVFFYPMYIQEYKALSLGLALAALVQSVCTAVSVSTWPGCSFPLPSSCWYSSSSGGAFVGFMASVAGVLIDKFRDFDVLL
jgi:hypothetical protein